MSENDLIRRGDARNAVIQSTGAMDAVSNINSLPSDDRVAKLVEAFGDALGILHDHVSGHGDLERLDATLAAWDAGK